MPLSLRTARKQRRNEEKLQAYAAEAAAAVEAATAKAGDAPATCTLTMESRHMILVT